MAVEVFMENAHTKNRYKVVGLDREAGTITMTGKHNVPFTVAYSKELFEKMGYTLVKEEAAPAPPPPPAPTDTVVVA